MNARVTYELRIASFLYIIFIITDGNGLGPKELSNTPHT
jgi:hypothetical protein